MEQQGQLVADEVRRARRPGLGVGAVERDDTGPVGEVLAPGGRLPVVQAVVAPQVVGLPGGDAVLQHVGRGRGVVADRERHELLLAPAADELEEVTAREPLLRDADRRGGRPRAGDGGGAGRDHRGGLGPGGDEVALPEEPAAQSLVVAHAVRLHLHGACSGVDEEGDVVTRHRAHLAGEPLECVVGLDEVADPVERAGLGVLGDQPRRGRHHDSARQLGVDHRRAGLVRVMAGPGRHAVLRPGVGEACSGQPDGAERGELQEAPPVQAAGPGRVRRRRGVGAAVHGRGLHEYECTEQPCCIPIGARHRVPAAPPTIPG